MNSEIALALSGGGYRAAMFHLGTLSYLKHVALPNGKSILDVVNTYIKSPITLQIMKRKIL